MVPIYNTVNLFKQGFQEYSKNANDRNCENYKKPPLVVTGLEWIDRNHSIKFIRSDFETIIYIYKRFFGGGEGHVDIYVNLARFIHLYFITVGRNKIFKNVSIFSDWKYQH